ncbi:MAG: YihY/virulence factor BrkB family protein [Pirellulales bacterium]
MAIVKQALSILQTTVTRWSRNDGNLLAASMAYYAAFSFFPLLLVLMSALGFALKVSTSAQSAKQQLLDFVGQSTAPALADEVSRLLAGVQINAGSVTLVGWLILLLAAIGIFSQLESAFDRLWHAAGRSDRGVRAAIRNALWNRLKAFLTLLGLGVVLIVAFVAELILTAFRNWGEEEQLFWTSSLVPWLHVVTSVALNALVVSMVFKMIPRAMVRWRHAVTGGIAVAVVWQIGSQILSRFVVGGHYVTAYGIVGSFIAMMLWVYCASILLFLGAQLVQVLGHPEESPAEPPPAAAGRTTTSDGKRGTRGIAAGHPGENTVH